MYDDYEDGQRSEFSDTHSRGAAAEYYKSGRRPHRTEYYYANGRRADDTRTQQTIDEDSRRDCRHPDHNLAPTRARSAHSHSSSAHSHRHHDHRRESSSDSSRRRSSHHEDSAERKWEQAAGAALVAGAIEAFRVRNEHGKWAGSKGAQVATAAIGAAAIDAGIDRDPDRHSKRHIAEATVGGLLLNRVANGPRDHR